MENIQQIGMFESIWRPLEGLETLNLLIRSSAALSLLS